MKVGIAGFGTIGRKVALALDQGIENLVLCGVSTRSAAPALTVLQGLSKPAPLMTIEELARAADIGIVQIFDFDCEADSGCRANHARAAAANAEYRRERHVGVLIIWNVYACNTRHLPTPLGKP